MRVRFISRGDMFQALPCVEEQKVDKKAEQKALKEKKKQEKIDLSPAQNLQPKSRSIHYDNLKSARAEETVVVLGLREPALLDQVSGLTPQMFSSNLLGRAFSQMLDRHAMGQDVTLSGLVNFEPEEMSHFAGLLRQQEGPVSEQAFLDCVQTIRREYQSSRVETEEDLMALRNKMKERKGIKA